MSCTCKIINFDGRDYDNIEIENLHYFEQTQPILTLYCSSISREKTLIILSEKRKNKYATRQQIYRQGYSYIKCAEIDDTRNLLEQDLYCVHNEIFMTTDDFKNLEYLLLMSSKTVHSYLFKIGFKFVGKMLNNEEINV